MERPEHIAVELEDLANQFRGGSRNDQEWVDDLRAAAALIRAQFSRVETLEGACTEALELLKRGAPGWGVAKDILGKALKAHVERSGK